MNHSGLIYEVEGGIATVRLNCPGTLNALTFETYGDLERLMGELSEDVAVQVVVLTGTGKGFCSGGNVNETIGRLVRMTRDSIGRFNRMTCNVVGNMRRLKKPIIAAVNGIAAGAGAALALASDFRILSERAEIAFLFSRVGLSGADMGSLYLLPRIVGQGKATELLFLGDPISAQEAYRVGLAYRVVPHDTLMETAYALARRLQEAPLYALGVTKEILGREANMSLDAALEMEAMAQAGCMETPDFQEGYRAFVEKRPPKFNKAAG